MGYNVPTELPTEQIKPKLEFGELFSSCGQAYHFVKYNGDNSAIGMYVGRIGNIHNPFFIPCNSIDHNCHMMYPLQPMLMLREILDVLENSGRIDTFVKVPKETTQKITPQNGRLYGLQFPLTGFEYLLLERVQIK